MRNRFFFFKFYLFIYLWLRWVLVFVRGLSPVAASGGHSSSRCAGLSLSRPLLLRSTGSGRAGSAVVAHGPSCSAACGIFPDQGSNPCPLHRQADSQPLRHQGSCPEIGFYFNIKSSIWPCIFPKCDSSFSHRFEAKIRFSFLALYPVLIAYLEPWLQGTRDPTPHSCLLSP